MIDPHWQVVDLDPVTWRHLGPFFEPQQYIAAAQPGEHGLFVLHDQGQVLKVVDTQARTPPAGIPAQITDPEALAQELFERGTWERVHIIDRSHLAWVAQQAQSSSLSNLTLDAYYHLVYTLVWGRRGGYVSEPPPDGHWHGWTYTDIRSFIMGLPSPATLALGVYSDAVLSIGLVLICEGGQIRLVTTFEGLTWTNFQSGPTQQTLTALCEALDAQFAPPAAVLLCTDAVFSGWLTASDKLAYLDAARENATAIWHISSS
ncbi:MAG TPA: hypothetical protein VGT44_03155 [Ktedonobacteraceae bacterium]|nr:hypothetical protein [Ktedonobacteraceae bacterium]